MREGLCITGLTEVDAGYVRGLFADGIRSYSAFITPVSFPFADGIRSYSAFMTPVSFPFANAIAPTVFL